jgi:hypothetical protein
VPNLEGPIGPRVSVAGGRQSSSRRAWGALAVVAGLLLAGGITVYVLRRAPLPQAAPIITPTPASTASSAACPDTKPTPRTAASLAYDSLHHALVLFGGEEAGNLPESNETWTFSGGCWRLERPATSPPGRTSAVLAYDPIRKVTVLYGGYQHKPNQPTTILSDTWIWNGTSWSQVATGTAPDIFTFHGAFDPGHGVLVIFGAAPNAVPETWTWNGSRWTRESPAGSPPPRAQGVMAYDPATRRVLLYGGHTDSAPGNLGDTWLWDGTNWTEQHPAASPGPRQDAAMAPAQALLLYSGEGIGFRNDTWLWTGSTWRQVTPVQNPGARAGAAATGNRTTVWLFGGTVYPPGASGYIAGDLWLWDGSNWSQVLPQ